MDEDNDDDEERDMNVERVNGNHVGEMTDDGGTNRKRPRAGRLIVAGLVATALLVGAAGCGSSDSDSNDADGAAGIEVDDARIPEPAKPDVAALYLSITNTGSDGDVLESVTTSAGGTAEVHQTEMSDGVASMNKVDSVTVDGDSTVEFSPGGYHVMIMGPSSPLEEGDRVEVTLHFAQTGDVVLDVPVVAAADVFAGADADSGHDEANAPDTTDSES